MNHFAAFLSWMSVSVIQVNGTFNSWSFPRVQNKVASDPSTPVQPWSLQEVSASAERQGGALAPDSSSESYAGASASGWLTA